MPVTLLDAPLTVQQPDAEWRTRISAIQNATVASDDSTDNLHNGFKVLRKGPKRGKTSAIPEVHTFHATEVCVPPLLMVCRF
jgi:centromere protein I